MLCEGQRTEPGYFRYVGEQLRDALITIKILGGGTPLQLVDRAIDERDRAEGIARREQDHNAKWDQVWCVVDVDHHASLPDALELARKKGIRMAVSNPCFELWPLLHFADQRAYIDTAAVIRRLEAFIPDYDKKLDCSKLRGHYRHAAKRAQILKQQHTRNGQERGNPSTEVVVLVEAFVTAARASAPHHGMYDERL